MLDNPIFQLIGKQQFILAYHNEPFYRYQIREMEK
jgi:hypothetical protein